MCNAQNSICNNFEGALAFSYESYTLGLYIPDEGSQRGSLKAIIGHFWVTQAFLGRAPDCSALKIWLSDALRLL